MNKRLRSRGGEAGCSCVSCVSLCARRILGQHGDTVQARTPMGSTGERASMVKTEPWVPTRPCLSSSIPSKGKQSMCLPGVENPLVTAGTHLEAEITKILHPFTESKTKQNSKQTHKTHSNNKKSNSIHTLPGTKNAVTHSNTCCLLALNTQCVPDALPRDTQAHTRTRPPVASWHLSLHSFL